MRIGDYQKIRPEGSANFRPALTLSEKGLAMASKPDTTIASDDKQDANVVEFPRETVAMQRLRVAQREVERWAYKLEHCDPHSTELKEALQAKVAPDFLALARDDLREAEAELAMLNADDTLRFGGQVYRAVRSSAGAN